VLLSEAGPSTSLQTVGGELLGWGKRGKQEFADICGLDHCLCESNAVSTANNSVIQCRRWGCETVQVSNSKFHKMTYISTLNHSSIILAALTCTAYPRIGFAMRRRRMGRESLHHITSSFPNLDMCLITLAGWFSLEPVNKKFDPSSLITIPTPPCLHIKCGHCSTPVFSLQGETDEQNQAEPPHQIVINDKPVLSPKCNKAKWKLNERVPSCQGHQTTTVRWLDHKGKYQNFTSLI